MKTKDKTSLMLNDASNSWDCDCDCDCHALPTLQSKLSSTYLELTPACNSRCVGCSNVFITDKPTRNMEIAQAPLPIDAWRTILSKLSPHVERVSITGGEPTLYKYFPQFMDLLNEFGLRFTLFTNARWVKPQETVTALAQTDHLNGLLISMHGADAATHEAFTLIKGSYQETIKNIKLATSADIPVTMSCIITRHSYDQVEAVYQLSQSLGVRSVVFNRYVGTLTDEPAPDSAQLKQALIDVERLRVAGERVKLSVTVPQCFHPTSTTGCGAGESFYTIDPWGNVKPCNHTPMILGNLRHDSLEQIQASEQLTYWRNLVPAGCHSCSAQTICGGGCRAEAMLNQAQSDTLIQDPYLPEHNTEFLILPEYLHPLATHQFSQDDFLPNIDCQTRQVLSEQLNGAVSLKALGQQHGQRPVEQLLTEAVTAVAGH
ncbi:radical SAM protein [Anaerolineales bacterium HSG24]|nr:radical SAM protein [Anaerolineales bacterium HSG24]